MITIPIKTKLRDRETDVLVTVRGMDVLRGKEGEPRVVLDDYDVHYANGVAVPVDLLDENDELQLAVEEVFEDIILPRRPEPGPAFRPQPKPADGQVTEAAA